MDTRTLLAKVVALIFKTRQLEMFDHDDLIRTILDTIKIDNKEQVFLGSNNTVKFKDYVVNLLEEKEGILLETLIPTLTILLENDVKLLNVIKDSISSDQDEGTIKRVISSHIKTLNNYYKETLAIEVISRMSYDLKFNRSKIGNFSNYLKDSIAELEPLATAVTSIKDPALVNEVDFENPESLSKVLEEVKNLNTNKSIYKFGWQALNRMTQGGLRALGGELVTIAALQHNYKTSMSLSVFTQIATINTPVMTTEDIESGKKPLLLRISLEDNLTNNLQFMYQYLKAVDGEIIRARDFDAIDTGEMTQYIMKKLTVNGFYIKMLRVDPSQMDVSYLINTIIGLEAQGYKVHVCMVDYVTMMSTRGCTQGATGADKRDLLRRIRNFMSARGVTFITPLQMSTEAKQLIRNGVPEHMLVKEVANRGYYADSKQLDQEIDLELYIHLASHNRRKYLTCHRGKHRLPTIVENEDDLYFILPFVGPHAPIIEDINTDDISMRTLPRGVTGSGGSALLEEMLG